MTNDKPYDIRERTFLFARRILEIAGQLPRTPECNVIREQLVASGTSVGANVEEADGASSRRDFRNKMNIAGKEAKETLYWLKLISGKYLGTEEIASDIQECNQLVRILSSIIEKSDK